MITKMAEYNEIICHIAIKQMINIKGAMLLLILIRIKGYFDRYCQS